ncbi:MAG: hypothetical protein AMS27_04680 [Bacteroides sp. SM23_62_1]|nr:MAG: hypothetical protein AMS27_04680 [Bacteroides sp. SM23_62_1]
MSCDDDAENITGLDFSGSNGVFIVNEGNYTYDNASLSFLEFSSQKIYNGIFFTANGTNLGDVAHSMLIYNNKGYIIVNNSGKIIIIDPDTGIMVEKLTGLISPRYVYNVNKTKGYISDLYSMKITMFDPEQNALTGFITVQNNNPINQHSTEQMTGYNEFVFIACWSFDNQILVLDSLTDLIVDSITVTKQPNSIVLDCLHKLWILSDGGFPGSAYGQEIAALTRIDAETRSVDLVLPFPSLSDSPVDLVINGSADTLYFINNGIYRMSVTDQKLPDKPSIVVRNENFYSLAVDPVTSIIYAGDAIDYQQNGLIYRFSPNGELIDSFRVGINPGSFCFKY